MKKSDEDHAVPASELVGYLQEIGISAERRSIYNDIEIFIFMYLLFLFFLI